MGDVVSFFTPITSSSIRYLFLSTSLKVIYGIFPLAIRIPFRQKTLRRTVLSFFSSSMRAPSQMTPRFCSPIGLLMFQNLSSLRILEWLAICKPLTIFLKANSIYFPVRVQSELIQKGYLGLNLS